VQGAGLLTQRADELEGGPTGPLAAPLADPLMDPLHIGAVP
jgi:hypothetical protein